MASHTLLHVDLNPTIGILQIGSLIGVFLFGVVSLQVYNYFDMYKEDGWVNKSLVATIWLTELAHTLGISYEVYRATITLYGEPQLLVKFEAIGAVVVFGGAITLLVQAFFALRLVKLFPGPYKYIGAGCIGTSFLRFVATIFLTVTGITAKTFAQYRDTYGWLITTTFVVGAAVDIIIAGSMMYYLARKRGKEMERIYGLINRLVAFTVRSGLLTSAASVSLVICLQAMPGNTVWLAVYTFVTKLYSNSLLSALNSRKEMREEVLRSSLFARPKTIGQESNTMFSNETEQPFEMIHTRKGMEGSSSSSPYPDSSKLKPAILGVYRISESEEEPGTAV